MPEKRVPSMQRFNMYLSREDFRALKRIAKSRGDSIALLVRRGIQVILRDYSA